MKYIMFPFDLLMSMVLFCLFAIFYFFVILINFFRLKKPKSTDSQVMLTILSGSIEANRQRNIDFIYDASPLKGFFKHCYFIYYLADKSRVLEYNSENTLL